LYASNEINANTTQLENRKNILISYQPKSKVFELLQLANEEKMRYTIVFSCQKMVNHGTFQPQIMLRQV